MSLTHLCSLSGHTDRVWCVAWHPAQADVLASCGGDRRVKVWRKSASGSSWYCTLTIEKNHGRTVRWVAWSPCGKYLACASFDANTTIYEISNAGYTLVTTLEGHENEVKCVAWNAGGNLLATCSRDKTIEIWERVSENDFEMASVLHGHQQDIKHVVFHPTKQVLFSASYDDTLRQWQEEEGLEDDWYCSDVLGSHTSTAWAAAFEKNACHPSSPSAPPPSSPRLVSCSDDCSLIVWAHLGRKSSDESGKATKAWQNTCTLSGYHTDPVYSVDWSGHGLIASGGADNSIRVFQEESHDEAMGTSSWSEVLHVENAHDSDVNCVRWHPQAHDNGLLASAGDDNLVKIWQYTTLDRKL